MAPPMASCGGGCSRGLASSVSRFWHRTYASEYTAFVLLLTGYILIQFYVVPFHRMFSVNDLRISFPHAEVERVPLLHDFIYALFIPLFILVLHNRLTGASAHKHHVTILGLAISMILTAFLTDVIKNTVGRPRPDLLARCAPIDDTPPNALVDLSVCTQGDHHTLHDGWRSFPSGHSSFAFAGLGYLSLFLCAQGRVFSRAAGAHAGRVVRGDLLRALACFAPLLGAALIAISRVQDYRHDVWDVVVGSALGWTVTYWCYRRYWRRLSSARCDEPYADPPGAAAGGADEAVGYGRLRDEEEGVVERGAAGRNVGFERMEVMR
ncbi:PAP2-domain-containing protein [Trichocladium antarcticum]|uniref:PAP2-domain-containing protein n=1 Tax=Trichocladium antarcticum TaxID=1450529 RepID=A0AAN6UNQ4_9PEZI|nr:PAP2-domain-containing protein [Trichocladium antarcticum]